MLILILLMTVGREVSSNRFAVASVSCTFQEYDNVTSRYYSIFKEIINKLVTWMKYK